MQAESSPTLFNGASRTVTTEARFQHARLQLAQSIRILVLEPQDPDANPYADRLRCSLKEIPLQDAKSTYEALSYCWGKGGATLEILCDGKSFLISENLATILYNLRDEHHPRNLWVDAICIDQSTSPESMIERVDQIKMMGEVYASSSQAVIWFGEPVPRQLIKLLNENSSSEKFLWASWKQKLNRIIKGEQEYGSFYKTLHLRDVLEEPWIQRAWTIQEAYFAPKALVCSILGTFPWSSFCQLLQAHIGDAYQTLEQHHLSALPRVSLPRRVYKRIPYNVKDLTTDHSETMYPEHYLLMAMPYFEATVPVDRVFGMYSLFWEFGIKIPEPDYGKDFVTALGEVVLTIIYRRRKLNFLAVLNTSGSRPVSWIPSFTPEHPYSTADAINPGSRWTKLNATLSSIISHRFDQNSAVGQLCVKGAVLGSISWQGTSLRHSQELSSKIPIDITARNRELVDVEDVRIVRSWATEACAWFAHNNLHGTNQEALTQFGRTVTAALGRPSDSDSEKAVAPWLRVLLSRETKPPKSAQDIARNIASQIERSRKVKAFQQEISAKLRGHCPFILCSKHDMPQYLSGDACGMAGGQVIAGDIAVLLNGCDFPVVLRPTGEHYRYMCPAYVYGCEDGKYWDKVDKASLQHFIIA